MMLTVDVSDEEDGGVGGRDGEPEEDVGLHGRSEAGGESKNGKSDAAVEKSFPAAEPAKLSGMTRVKPGSAKANGRVRLRHTCPV